MNKKRILIVSDPLSQVTGLAYVAGSFARHFLKKPEEYKVGYFTLRGTFDNVIRAVNNDVFDECSIYSMPSANTSNLIKNFTQTIEDFNPHIVLTIADPWDLEVVAFNSYRYSYCWIAYSTIEVPILYSDRIYNNSILSNIHYKEFYQILKRADLIIPVTKMAKKALDNLNKDSEKLRNIYNGNIYNGLDIELKTTEKKSKFEVFNGHINNDDFLFFSLGVNSERKKLEQVIIAFAHFLKKLKKEKIDTSKIKLYMHTNMHSAPSGTDLRAVISEYSLDKYVLGMASNPAVERKKIYDLYSICDVYLGFPGGEGFGYGFAEAMLHSKPVVYIDHGGHTEFAKYGGLPVSVRDYVYAIKLGVKWALPNIEEAVAQMYKLYKDEELRKKLGREGNKYIEDNLSWDKISNKLESVILDYYNQTKDENLYGMQFKKLG